MYLHKYGKLEVKEWCSGNTYLDEAGVSPNVKHFWEQPFEDASFEEAEIIARNLLGVKNG